MSVISRKIHGPFSREITVRTTGRDEIYLDVRKTFPNNDVFIGSAISRKNAKEIRDALAVALEATKPKPKPTKAERIRQVLQDPANKGHEGLHGYMGRGAQRKIASILDEDGPL